MHTVGKSLNIGFFVQDSNICSPHLWRKTAQVQFFLYFPIFRSRKLRLSALDLDLMICSHVNQKILNKAFSTLAN